MLLNLTRYLPSKRSLYSDSILKKTHTTAVTSSGVNEHNWTIWIFIHRRLLRLWYSQFSRLSQAINSKKQTYITQLTRCINTWPESTVRISGQHQKQSPEVFYKQRFLKNFTIFTGKHLFQSLFLIELQATACNVIKETLAQMLPCEFCKSFKHTFFTEHLWTIAYTALPWILSNLVSSHIYCRTDYIRKVGILK